ncbi:MAG: hypothetical protein IT245_06420 [Bacteroidia bacterium]|nr:hypothetical protein [Bacteroidia bacterium]
MKAAKNIIPLVALSLMYYSCSKDKQTPQKLDESTKEYFDVKDGSKYIFTEVSDTNITLEYTSQGYINTQSNPDIENNEILTYDLICSGQPSLTMRAESGGAQFKDRIAIITRFNDTTVIGPVCFNLGGVFSTGVNSFDSIKQHLTYTINGQVFEDVVRIKPYQNSRYKEIFFAKKIGLIARKEVSGKFYYIKRWRINK